MGQGSAPQLSPMAVPVLGALTPLTAAQAHGFPEPQSCQQGAKDTPAFPQRPPEQVMLGWQPQLLGTAEAVLPFGPCAHLAREEKSALSSWPFLIQGAFSKKEMGRKEESSPSLKTE